MRSVLKTAIKRMGLNPSLYTVHGTRGGRANDLLSMGLSVEAIKKLGRWKSNAVYVYLK